MSLKLILGKTVVALHSFTTELSVAHTRTETAKKTADKDLDFGSAQLDHPWCSDKIEKNHYIFLSN